MSFWDLIDINNRKTLRPKCDLTYFELDQNNTLANGLNVWRWRLDGYGINKSEFAQPKACDRKIPFRTRIDYSQGFLDQPKVDWVARRKRILPDFPLIMMPLKVFSRIS